MLVDMIMETECVLPSRFYSYLNLDWINMYTNVFEVRDDCEPVLPLI